MDEQKQQRGERGGGRQPAPGGSSGRQEGAGTGAALGQSGVAAEAQQATLILEIELPNFYALDLLPGAPDWKDWLETVDVDPDDAAAVGQEILHNIGEVYSGLLTIECNGEKDSEIVRTPVAMIGARVEARPPKHPDPAEHLTEKVDEPRHEEWVLGKMDHAELTVLRRFAKLMRDEYTGQVSGLAEQAVQEARLAADDAEARYAPMAVPHV